MKLKLRYYTITLLLSGCMYNAYSQDLNYKFFQYNQKDGLVNNTVQAISQDRMGYIWLGTLSGLSRYDGTNFNNYINESSDSTSLSNNAIWDILEDKKGNLWVATEYGLNLFNREQDNFKRFFHRENDSASLGNSLVKDILETRDGKIFVATFSPILSVYRPEKIILKTFQLRL